MYSRDRPAWFKRVYNLARRRQKAYGTPFEDCHDLLIRPNDYDEDLSDCSSNASVDFCGSEHGCTFDENDECTKHRDRYDSDTSHGTNASGLGLDYYEMKRERKKRKRAIRDDAVRKRK